MGYFDRWPIHKFNENHDEKGRFSAGAGIDSGLGERMIEAGKAGGFTYDAHGDTPTEGFSVGVHPERSGIFPVETVKPEDVDRWLAKNKDIAFTDTGKMVGIGIQNMVGGWVDQGKLWLDLVAIFPPDQKEAAIAAGKQHNQISIADLGAIHKGDWDHAFIQTGGTGEAMQKSDKKLKSKAEKPKLVLFPKNATGAEILAKLGITPKK